MAKQGSDRPRAPERRGAPSPQVERTGPKQYFGEVRGEMKKVAWPPRAEIVNSSIIVLVGLVIMTALIFGFDWTSVHVVDFVFK
ncbi:MAG TPA: preprotein translocase subunit SecE [Acidimicrobiia bacterium]|jgi:preprotein translocase subunit SecE|nr:preprotein translocase subunit SecE [Acidimicrobiia bacterium]